jgi:transcriptional regulator with XRE-family HTH domain
MTFGQKLEVRRRALGLSQIDIVDRLKKRGRKKGAGRATVSNWFNSKSIPPGDICLQLAEVLEVPIEYLLDDRISLPLPPKAHEAPGMVVLMGIVNRIGMEAAIDRLIGSSGARISAPAPAARR